MLDQEELLLNSIYELCILNTHVFELLSFELYYLTLYPLLLIFSLAL